MSSQPNIALEDIDLATGGYLIVQRALRDLPEGGRLRVDGRHPALRTHLAAWCRSEGHSIDLGGDIPVVVGDQPVTRAGTGPSALAGPAPTAYCRMPTCTGGWLCAAP